MQLYNTLGRRKEEFVPREPGKVGLYACGITAYDYCHIGHARSAVVFDVLVRYLRHLGYTVTFVRNFTDVDDKIINRANEQGVDSKEIAERFIAAFHEDMDRLAVLRATVEPKATEYIGDMIALCETLIAKGSAYATASGDVYFRVRSFAGYGKLSGRSVDDLRSGARVQPGEEKEDPLDFALWKAAKPGEPSWDSPWGQGRPGWHIECSAMSERELPLPLDIHGGGQDLIFPHHENEIAQSEAATGKEFARFWVHNGFVQIDSEKMSKSLNNFKTIREILEQYLPEVLRLFLLARHYRSPVDFTAEAMDEAEKNIKRLYETLRLLEQSLEKDAPKSGDIPAELQAEYEGICAAWDAAMADDMNTAAALGHSNTLFHLIGRILDDKALRKNRAVWELLREARQKIAGHAYVLGVLLHEPDAFLQELKECRAKRKNIDPAVVERLLEERRLARQNKDFAASDALRDALAELGVEVRDTPGGAVWDVA
ncbi:cysteine--tRNA ligase [Desulfovibrio sp. OttesenSCG-928-A18]|nr:cysteine--tRNA ligase [Desulfovibrio sp. OttesenSCG-928-A18]